MQDETSANEIMDDLTQRKLSILLHLANIDGHYHQAEDSLLRSFVRKHGLDESEFYLLKNTDDPDMNMEDVDDKAEMLYLAIKIMQADEVIQKQELEFCELLAGQLGYDPSIVRDLANRKFSSRFDFDDYLEKVLSRTV